MWYKSVADFLAWFGLQPRSLKATQPAATWATRANLRSSLQNVQKNKQIHKYANTQIYKYIQTCTAVGRSSTLFCEYLPKLDWLVIDGFLCASSGHNRMLYCWERGCNVLRHHQTVKTHPHGKSKAKFAFNWRPFILHTVNTNTPSKAVRS